MRIASNGPAPNGANLGGGSAFQPAGERRLLQRYMPSLDVLRGLAILWVLLNHALIWDPAPGSHAAGHGIVYAVAKGGWLGVNLFFVLSGFLITGILLDDRGNEVYYQRFYKRRALRILPVYLLLVAVLLALRSLSTGALLVALTFTTNYAFLFGVRQPYGPLWSIAVEEQFYLVWPAVLRRLRTAWLAAFCIAIVVLDPLLRGLCLAGRLPPADIQRNALLIADNLACGALAALFVRSRYGVARAGRRMGLAIMIVALLGEAAGLPFGIAHRTTPFGAALQHTPFNLLFTGLLLFLLSLPSRWFASAWSRPLRFLGYVSYGLYLCHLLIFDLYDRVTTALGSTSPGEMLRGPAVRLVLAGSLSVLVAWLSRRFYEDPFLRIRVGSRPSKLLRQEP